MKYLSIPRCGLLLLALLATGGLTAHAQSVGIGTTAPDASAALDIVSSTKGLLLPRVAVATALATPATGLLVFQTGVPAGFYYNAGTPGAPGWQPLATAAGAAVTASNGLTKTGSVIGLGGPLSQATTIAQAGNTFSLTGGNVGIGTSSPAGLLTVQGSALGAGVLDQQQLTSNTVMNETDYWQSFTAGVSGTLTRLDLSVSSSTGAPGTLSIYAGEGTGGALLSTQAILYNNGFGYQAFPLATSAAVVAGQQYTYRSQTPSGSQSFAQFSFTNPYAGGRASSDATWDWCFKTYVAQPVATNVLTALAGGNVGIGTATPGAQLHVAGNMKIDGANTLEFGAGVSKEINAGKIGYQVFSTALDIVGAGTSGTDRKIKFWAEGGAVFTGSVTGVGAFNTSDRRFKQNIRPLTSALAAVLALRGVRYEWNALGQQHGGTAGAGQVGLIAQEVEKLYPELVSTGADGYKAVNYAQLTPVLIEALKELKAENDALKARATATEAGAPRPTTPTCKPSSSSWPGCSASSPRPGILRPARFFTSLLLFSSC